MENPSKEPTIRELLQGASRDVRNARHLPFLRLVTIPLSDLVVAPLLDAAASRAPATSRDPMAKPSVLDDACRTLIGETIHIVKAVYTAVPFKEDLEKGSWGAKGEIFERPPYEAQHGLGGGLGLAASILPVIGFVWNSFVDLATSFWDFKGLVNVLSSLASLQFLWRTGALKSVTGNLATSRALPSDVAIMERVQMENMGLRVDEASQGADKFPSDDGEHYMKYATAAYGDMMMQAVERSVISPMAGVEMALTKWMYNEHNEQPTGGNPLCRLLLFPVRAARATLKIVFWPLLVFVRAVTGSYDNHIKNQMAFYLKLSPKDIVYMTKYYWGGSPALLRHFVAVDRRRRAVVISLRGTYSVSGLITDAEAEAVSYCDGIAHYGMALMADNIWHDSDTILAINEAMSENNIRKFIIVGHSLGAGTACLLNIKCHHDNFANLNPKPLEVKCMGYASPPVYSPISTPTPSVQEAIANSTCYVHQVDCVPFLSVEAVVRLTDTIVSENDIVVKLPRKERLAIAAGKVPPSSNLRNAILKIHPFEKNTTPGGDRLYIPGHCVWWLCSDDGGNTYKAIECSSKKVASLTIQLNVNMINDHMPPTYEDAFERLT